MKAPQNTRYRYDPFTRQLQQVIVDASRRPTPEELPLGATIWGNGVGFLIWAPKAQSLQLVVDGQPSPIDMKPAGDGYYFTFVEGVGAHGHYGYRINGEGDVLPDPVSHRQPNGVLGISEVVDSSTFQWTDSAWHGRPLSQMSITEAHVGTLTPGGTLKSAKDAVRDLVANTIELMPLHQFPGARNWGYDPAQLYAVQNSYGTPDELREFVNYAHRHKKAVLVDVVHNHPGPQGAFSGAFGPYFDRGNTPWGGGVSVEGREGRHIARHFVENAVYWLNECQTDGLRFDATVYLPDELMVEMSHVTDQLERLTGRTKILISENNRNNRKVTLPVAQGGHGFDGQWSMDLQYALRVLLTNERGWRLDRYIEDPFKWVARAVARGWAFEGEESPYEKDKGPFGTSAEGLDASSFVVAKDDHDQIGNTARGERLGQRIGERLDRAVDALYAMMPFTVMNFQGDDYRASEPFYFFVDVNEELGEAINNGRNKEWAEWLRSGSFPHPNSPKTYQAATLDPKQRETPAAQQALALSRQLEALRAEHPVLSHRSTQSYQVLEWPAKQTLVQRRWSADGHDEIIAFTNLSQEPVTIEMKKGTVVPTARDAISKPLDGSWSLLLNSDAENFGGSGELASFDGKSLRPGVSMNLTDTTKVTLPAASVVYLQRQPQTSKSLS